MKNEIPVLGVYMSGTGNTKYCVERLARDLDPGAVTTPVESDGTAELIRRADLLVLGYPTQFSNAPLMVRDYIRQQPDLWSGKHIICLTTMGAFSGDGTGCAARVLRKYGAIVAGGLQVRMPDSVCDKRALKKSREENHEIVLRAAKKIDQAAEQIKNGKYPREGLGFLNHIAGLFGQRLWFYGRTSHYAAGLKIDPEKCVGCGTCAEVCPMGNIHMQASPSPDPGEKPIIRAVPGTRCAMCYRCISLCPSRAVTLLGTEVVEQCRLEKYL
ncbi:MAG: EFR1 family ferrodoxin [Oscillospiraceae bacterium]|jgi:ferredoxin/flavodoxin